MDNAQEIYARFLSGDAAAFDDLVRAFRVPLTRFLTAYLHDPDLAEDVAADCFAYVWAYPKRYIFRSGVKTYLFMLGRSRAIDRLRREKRVVFVEPDDPVLAAEASVGPQGDLEEREKRRALIAAVRELPEEERLAVTLVYYEELSYKDAARVMGKSAKQVDHLLVKARRHLKAVLKDWGDQL